MAAHENKGDVSVWQTKALALSSIAVATFFCWPVSLARWVELCWMWMLPLISVAPCISKLMPESCLLQLWVALAAMAAR